MAIVVHSCVILLKCNVCVCVFILQCNKAVSTISHDRRFCDRYIEYVQTFHRLCGGELTTGRETKKQTAHVCVL